MNKRETLVGTMGVRYLEIDERH